MIHTQYMYIYIYTHSCISLKGLRLLSYMVFPLVVSFPRLEEHHMSGKSPECSEDTSAAHLTALFLSGRHPVGSMNHIRHREHDNYPACQSALLGQQQQQQQGRKWRPTRHWAHWGV